MEDRKRRSPFASFLQLFASISIKTNLFRKFPPENLCISKILRTFAATYHNTRMKPKNKNQEVDINDVAMTLEVDSSVIEGVRSGKVKGIAVSIRDLWNITVRRNSHKIG